MARTARTATHSSPDGDPGLDAFLRAVELKRSEVPDFKKYPFAIPALRELHRLTFHKHVTFLVGENGSGKSTLLEAIAVAAGFNAEGGSRNFRFSTRPSESELHAYLRLVRGVRRPKTGYFLRAESFFNVATQVDQIPDTRESHGGVSLHEQSHGESFMALIRNRFGPNGLYLLDEPEAALSPSRQMTLLKSIQILVQDGNSQLIIATHSPIVLAYPDARIYMLNADGISEVDYEDTEHYALTRDFLQNRERYLERLFKDESGI